LLAAAVLGLSDAAIAARLDRWRAEQTKKVAEEPREEA
jgi:5-(carboxyamino)imidazole ribonucleotide mutase